MLYFKRYIDENRFITFQVDDAKDRKNISSAGHRFADSY